MPLEANKRPVKYPVSMAYSAMKARKTYPAKMNRRGDVDG